MTEITEHPTKKWVISITKLEENGNTQYKVTRRLPEMAVAETKMFNTEEEALQQSKEWLRE